MIKEILTGHKSTDQIPVIICTDSHPLKDSLYSTKQVERKTVRHIIQSMKDNLARNEIEKFIWVESHNIIADLLTKESADPKLIMQVLNSGKPKKAEINGGKIDKPFTFNDR